MFTPQPCIPEVVMHYPPSARQVALARPARELRDTLLAARRRIRRGAAAKLPREVKQLRKDISRGRARPCEMVLAVLLDDVNAGAPIEDVLAWPRQLEAVLRTRAAERDATLPRRVTLGELQIAEEQAEARLDEAQLWLAAEPRSEAALAAVESAAHQVVAATTDLLRYAQTHRYTTAPLSRSA